MTETAVAPSFAELVLEKLDKVEQRHARLLKLAQAATRDTFDIAAWEALRKAVEESP